MKYRSGRLRSWYSKISRKQERYAKTVTNKWPILSVLAKVLLFRCLAGFVLGVLYFFLFVFDKDCYSLDVWFQFIWLQRLSVFIKYYQWLLAKCVKPNIQSYYNWPAIESVKVIGIKLSNDTIKESVERGLFSQGTTKYWSHKKFVKVRREANYFVHIFANLFI